MSRWSVCKRNGQWRVYQDECWSDTFDTLEEAGTWAHQNAVADGLYSPGGLACLQLLTKLAAIGLESWMSRSLP